jgi:hypothetical protein
METVVARNADESTVAPGVVCRSLRLAGVWSQVFGVMFVFGSHCEHAFTFSSLYKHTYKFCTFSAIW